MQQTNVAKLDKHVKGKHGEEKWTREDFLQKRQQLVDGKLLSVDQSFKFAKLVRVRLAGRGSDTKPSHSVVTFFDEFEQAPQPRQYGGGHFAVEIQGASGQAAP
ncbi:unnamed protein product [Pylaiella littoralis]